MKTFYFLVLFSASAFAEDQLPTTRFVTGEATSSYSMWIGRPRIPVERLKEIADLDAQGKCEKPIRRISEYAEELETTYLSFVVRAIYECH